MEVNSGLDHLVIVTKSLPVVGKVPLRQTKGSPSPTFCFLQGPELRFGHPCSRSVIPKQEYVCTKANC